MKPLKLVPVFVLSFFLTLSLSCEHDQFEGNSPDDGGGGASGCVQATENFATATSNYNAVTSSDPNYTSVCSAYATALQDLIDSCGDDTDAFQGLLDSLDCSSDVPDDCPSAEAATASAETAYNADTTNTTLCNTYINALQNEIAVCGDDDGTLQGIIDGIECIEYSIGDIGPGGGFIFYLDGSGGGLEITPLSTQFQSQWGCYSTSIDGTLSALGTGQDNSNIILDYHNSINFYTDPDQCIAPEPGSGIMVESTGDVAAKNCDDLVFGGKDDWYLPSVDELHLAYTNLHAEGLGDFTTTFLASSTQEPGEHWKFLIVHFGDGGDIWGDWKSDLVNHRAIRSF